MKHFNIKIFGRVQGVLFRVKAKERSDELGLKGFVKNMPDGSVYIEAEGDEDALEEFLEWCKRGPESAKVDRVEVSNGTPQNFQEFRIK